MTLLFSIGRAARYLGVSPTSLRRWDRAGKLIAIRTPGNQRRYPKSQLDAFLGICDEDYETKPPHASTGIPYLYARVSSARQETDGNLDRQAERLVEAVHTKFGRKTPFHLIREYASGLNPLRSGLRRLIHAVQRGKVSVVMVTYPDRLTRFGFPFLEWWFAEHHVPILSCEPPIDDSLETEFVQDIMAILTCFSGKLYKGRALLQTQTARTERKMTRAFYSALESCTTKTISRLCNQLCPS